MAKGRMLNRSISDSDKFHALPDDTCRLLATWIIPHLDFRGVFYGAAGHVRSKVFPMRDEITNDVVAHYLAAMESVGLIAFFEVDGRRWQYWTGFQDNQKGLREDRETTTYPPPPGWLPEKSRKDSGKNPASGRQNARLSRSRRGKGIGKGIGSEREVGDTFNAPPNGDIGGDESASVAIALTSPQVKMWQEKTGQPLRPQQILDIYATAKDMARLETVLTYWLRRGWGEGNVPGILDLYVNWDVDIRNPANSKGKTTQQDGQLTGAAKAAEQTFARQQAGIAMAHEYIERMEREGNNGNFWTN